MRKTISTLTVSFLICSLLYISRGTAQKVEAGGYFSLAKCPPCGYLYAWGANWDGELGDSSYNDRSFPGAVHEITDVVDFSGGEYHVVALRNDSTVWAWGWGGFGQIGDGTYNERLEPVQTLGLTGVINVSAGGRHTLAVKSDGTVWAWGWNGYGQLGDSTYNNSNIPVKVKNLTGIIAVSAAYYHSMALKSDGTVWTWGYNGYGQLGDSTWTSSLVPVLVKGLTGITAISTGFYHSLALKSDGTLWSWGANWDGELGDGTYTSRNYRVQVLVLSNTVIAMDGGEYHSLAIKNDSTVWAWGYNGYGELGDNTYTGRNSPVQVLGGMNSAISVAAGSYHSLAMKSDGSVWGWGYNYEGQTGNGVNNNEYLLPERTLSICPLQAVLIDIDLSGPCTSYDTLPAGGNWEKYFTIHNYGCDNLVISNVTSSTTDFDVVSFPASIPPFDSAMMIIAFTPPVPGDYTANITVFNNDADTTFCIEGVAVPPPVMTTVPANFNFTLSCSDSISDTLYIINTGNSNLYTTIYGNENYDSAIFIQYFTWDATTIHTFPNITDVDSIYVTVTINGDYDSGSEYAEVYIDGTYIELIPDGDLLEQDIVRNYAFGGAQLNAWLMDGQIVVTVDNSPNVDNFGSTDYHIVQITYQGAFPLWMDVNPVQNTTPVSDTDVVIISLNTTGVIAGTYYSPIYVYSNDPNNLVDSIPLTLNVVGNPEIALSDTCLAFDTVFQFGTITDTLFITNTGCDTLELDSIIATGAGFVVDSFSVMVQPWTTGLVIVSFNPQTVGTFNESLNIFSNAPDTSVCLTGVSLSPPIMVVTPDPVNVTLVCTDTLYDTLTVSNAGVADLTFATGVSGYSAVFDGSGDWLNRNSTNLPTGSVMTVTAWIYPQGYADPSYNGIVSWGGRFCTGYAMLLSIQNNGRPSMATWCNDFVPGTGAAATLNQWNHIACVLNGTSVTLYMNGIPVSGTVSSAVIPTVQNYNLAIGVTDYPGRYFNGRIDEVRIYNRALSTAEVLETMKKQAVGNETGLSGYWNFDDQTANDITSNNNDLLFNDNATTSTPNAPILPSSIASWLNYSVVSGTLPASGTSQIPFTVNSSGMTAGQYNSGIIIYSNDPTALVDTVPVNLTINGSASISFSGACMDYDTIYQFASKTDTMVIYNTGCDTLFIDSIIPSDNQFIVDSAPNYILPYGSAIMIVTFAPVTAGTFNDVLTFYTNIPDTTLCLAGEALPPPIICYDPDSFNVTLNCSDTLILPLAIGNCGGNDLIFSFGGSGIGLVGDSSVLVIQETSAWGVWMPTYLQNNFGITPTVITSGQIPTTDFMQYDLIITVGDESSTYYSNISANVAKFNAFVAAGGMVQYQMATQGGSNINLVNGAVMIYGGQENQNTGLIPGHPLLIGLTNPLNGNSANHCYLTNVPVGALIITQTQSGALPTTIEYDYGKGKVIATGMTWEFLYNNGYNSGPMMYNSTSYLLSLIGIIPDWISLNPSSDTVVVGDTTWVDVTFISTGLYTGQYTTDIQVNSNDPVNPQVTIPCKLNVVGDAALQVALADTAFPSCLDLDSIMEFTTSSDVIYLINTGCDTLVVDSLKYSSPIYTSVTYSDTVLMGDTSALVVQFAPVATGTFPATVTVYTNVGDSVICLTGDAYPRPIESHSPDTIAVTLICADTIVDTLTVYNTGFNDLMFSTGPFGQSAVFDGSGDYIVNGSSMAGQFTNESFTMEVWFKANAAGVIVSELGQTTPNINWHDSHIEILSNGKVYVRVWCVAAVELGTVSFGTWNHAVLRYDRATNTLDGLLNGVEAPTNASGDRCSPPESGYGQYFALGAVDGTNMGSGAYFNGNIDEFRVWNYPRTNAQVQQDMNRMLSGSESGLVCYWNFDDGTATDLTPNPFNGIFAGNATADPPNAPVTSPVPQWLDYGLIIDTVATNDSAKVPVTLVSTGLLVGQYNSYLIISSNDPLNNPDTVPVVLTVAGAGQITLTQSCLYLDSIMVYTSLTNSLYIKNTGCDTLFISGINQQTPQFTWTLSDDSILFGDSALLEVTFIPDSIGIFQDTLVILNSDVTKTVCLSGYGFPRPIISENPTAINVSLSCADTVVVPVTVYNTGGNDLIFNIDTADYYAAFDGVNSYINLGTWFNYQTFTIELWVRPGATQKQYADIIDNNHTGSRSWVLQQNSTNTNQYSWGTNDGGGSALFTLTANQWVHIAVTRDGITRTNRVYINGSLFSTWIGTGNIPYDGTQFFRLARWGGGGREWNGSMDEVRVWNVARTQTQIASNMLTEFTGNEQNLIGYWNFELQNANDVTSYGNNGTLFGNTAIVRYPNNNIFTVSSVSDTVPPNDSAVVNVEISSTGLLVGTYNSDLIIQSNDPLSPYDTIDISLTVAGTPIVALSDTCLSHDTIMEFTTATRTLWIYNIGCDTLFIDSLSFTASEFTPLSGLTYIVPGDSDFVTVQFAPLDTGNFFGTLNIYSNANDTSVCLTGYAYPRPVVSYSPDTFFVTLVCADTLNDTLTIYNTGLSDLIYSTGVFGKSAVFDGSGDYIDVPDNASLDLPAVVTFETWLYVNTIQEAWTAIIGKPGRNYTLWLNSSRYIHLSYYGPGNTNINTPVNSINLNQWQHIAGVIDVPSGIMKVYIDGVEQASGSTTGSAILSGSPFRMGNNLDGGAGNYLNGKLDEVRVWNVARSQQDIQSTMNKSISGSEPGLVGYWNFDDGTATDFSPNTNNGTFYGNAVASIPNAPVIYGTSWLDYNLLTDTVAPNDSSKVPVTITSTGLLIGQYNSFLVLNSNDPLSSRDTIPFILSVIGSPVVALSDTCLGFDTIMEFTMATRTLWIYNTGCDTLFIDSISFTAAEFTPLSGLSYILMGDSDFVNVQFAPVDTGNFAATLNIFSNANDTAICLSGYAYPRPEISIVPDSFNITLVCCDSLSDTMKIYNSGGTSLIFDIPNIGGLPSPVRDFLIIDHGKSKASFTGYTTQTTNEAGFSGMTGSQLVDNRVIYFEPDWSNYNNLTSNMSNLSNYVNQGGVVVINIAGNIGNGTNIDPYGTDYSRATLHDAENFNLPAHPYLTGVPYGGSTLIPSNFNSWSNTDHGTLSNYPPGAEVVLTNSDGTSWIHYKWGNGHVILTSLTYRWGASPSSACDNLVDYAYYLASTTGVSWLSVSPVSDTVNPADSSILEFGFNSCGLLVGTYTTNVVINSNDPLNSADTVPVILNVVGTGEITLSDSCLNFDTIMEFTTASRSFPLTNTGCDTLSGYLVSSSGYFSLNTAGNDTVAINILPGDSVNTTVIFAPDSVGAFTGLVNITTNAGDSSVCLTGNTFPMPTVCYSPDSINVYFPICLDTIMVPVQICNSGGSSLQSSLWSHYGRSLTLDGSGDYVSVPDNVSLRLTTAFTIEAWIKPTTLTNYMQVISKFGWSNNYSYQMNTTNTGKLRVDLSTTGTTYSNIVSVTSLTAGVWNHIAATWNGSTVKLFINGVQDASTLSFSGTLFGAATTVDIGRVSGSNNQMYTGQIDEVRIFNRPLTPGEILNSMNATLIGNENGLMGSWNFDDGTAGDLTPNNNNGALFGNAAITLPTAEFIPPVDTVLIADTNIALVRLIKTGLPYGIFNFNAYLASNDPLNPEVIIPVIMNIDSLPPAPPVAADRDVCSGDPVPDLIGVGTGDTIKWFDMVPTLLFTGDTFATGETAVGVYSYMVNQTDTNGCVSTSDTVFLNINAAPGEPTADDTTVCSDATIPSLSSTGTIIKWYSDGALTTLLFTGNPYNTGQTLAGSYTYYVNDSTGACPASPADTVTLTINDAATVDAGINATICEGSTYTLSGTRGGGATSSVWTTSGTGTFSDSSQLAPVYFPSLVDIAMGSVILTLTTNDPDTSGPCTFKTDFMVLTINPAATVNAGADDTICSGSTYTLSGTRGGSATSSTWTSLGTGTFNNASLLAAVYTPSPADITAQSVTLVLTTNDPAGPCNAVGDTMILTINIAGTANAGADAPVCAGDPYTLSGAIGGGATSLVWTTSGSGTFSDSSLLAPVYTPSAGDISMGSATLTITTNDPDSSGPCSAVTDAMILTINAAPGEPVANDTTVCSDGTILPLSSTGTIIQWYSNGALTNLLFAGNPYNTGQTLPGSYTYYVTDSTGACPESPADTVTLTINNAAVVDAGTSATICAGETYTLSGSITGGTFSGVWTTSGTGTFSDSSLMAAVYTPSVADMIMGTVTLTLTSADPDGAGPCASKSDIMTVTINPAATVNAGADDTVCSGNTYTLSGTRGGSATSSTWTTLGSGTFNNSSLLAAVYTPSPADIASGSVLLALTTNDPAGPCPAVSDTMILTINAAATVFAGADAPVCSGDPYTLAGLIGGGATSSVWTTSGSGTFSDSSLLSALYTPSPADISAGSVILTLTTNDPDGAGPCNPISDDMTLSINPPPVLPTAADTAICSGAPVPLLSANGTIVQWYSDDSLTNLVNTGTTYNTGQTSPGVYNYYVTDSTPGCPETSADTATLTINDAATVSAGSDASLCQGSAYTLSGTRGGGATSSVWTTSGTGTFDDSSLVTAIYTPSGADISAGSVTLAITTNDPDGGGPCVAVSDTMVLYINAPAVKPSGSDTTVCSDATIPSLSATGTFVQWYSDPGLSVLVGTGNSYNTGQTTPGNYEYYATDSTPGCPESLSDTVTLTINFAATVNAGSDTVVCEGSAITLSGIIGGGASSSTWTTSGTGAFNDSSQLTAVYTPSAADMAAGNVILTLTSNDPDGTGPCLAAADAMVLTIDPAATANAGADGVICEGSAYTLSGAIGGGASSGLWSTGGSGSFDNASLLTATYTPSAGDIATGFAQLILTTDDPTGPCIAVSDTMTLNINLAATVNAGSDDTICEGDVALLAGSVGGSASSSLWSTSGTGMFDDTSSLTAIYSPSAADVISGSVTLTLTTNDPDSSEPCIAVSDVVVITINPLPGAPVASPDTLVCFGSPVPDLYATGGLNIQWYSDPSLTTLVYTGDTFTTGITAAGAYTFYVTQAQLGCEGSSDSVTLTVFQAPVPASFDTSICIGDAVPPLTATGTNLVWYSDAALTNIVGTGSTYTSGDTATGIHNYYVTDSVNGCVSLPDTSTLIISTPNTPPTSVTADADSICEGAPVNLVVVGGALGIGAQWVWYADSCGGTPVAIGDSITVNPLATTTFFVRGEGGCDSTVCQSVVVNVTQSASVAVTSVASSIDSICPGVTVNLTSTGGSLGTGASWQWYSDSCGGTAIGSGTSVTVNPSATTTYYIRAEGACNTTVCQPVTVNVTQSASVAATTIATSGDSLCPNTTVTLNVVGGTLGSGASWQWYTSSCGGTAAGTGDSLTLSLSATTDFFVRAEGTCNSTSCSAVTISVTQNESVAPLSINSSAATVCSGDAVTLSVSGGSLGSGGQYVWYEGSCGGVLTGTGDTVTFVPSSTNSWYVRAEGTCNTTLCVSTGITVNTTPSAPTATGGTVCEFDTVPDLTAVGTSIQWYSDSTLSTLVFSGNIYATGITTPGVYTYFATQTVNNCESPATTATLTINALPPAPASSDVNVCLGNPVPDFTATGSNIQWYDDVALTNLVGAGNTFASGQTAVGTYTYYATQTVNNCEGAAVTVDLNILLAPPSPVVSDVSVCEGNPVPPLVAQGNDIKWYADSQLTNFVYAGAILNTGMVNPGIYTYWATDSLPGCVSQGEDGILTITPKPAKPVGTDVTVCYGDAVPALTATGTNPRWYKDPTLVILLGTGNSYNTGITAVGSYNFYVADYVVGCPQSIADTVNLTINPKPLVTINYTTTAIALGDSVQLIAYNAISYVWSPATGLSSTSGSAVWASPTSPTLYYATGTNQYGCTNVDSVYVNVKGTAIMPIITGGYDLKLYPNPTRDLMVLEFSESTYAGKPSFRIFNMIGEVMESGDLEPVNEGNGSSQVYTYRKEIDFTGQAEGIYYMHLISGDVMLVRKMAVIR